MEGFGETIKNRITNKQTYLNINGLKDISPSYFKKSKY